MLCQCFLPAVSMPGSADLNAHPCRRGNLLALTALWHIPLLGQDRMTAVAMHRLILQVLWATMVDQALDANRDTTQGCANGSEQNSVTPDPKDTSAGNCWAVPSSPWHFLTLANKQIALPLNHTAAALLHTAEYWGNITFLNKKKLHKTSSLPQNNSGC